MNITDQYKYVGIFPVSLPNGIWMFMSLLLSTMYVSTYHIESTNFLGNFFQYALEYGKHKSSHISMDLPKRYFAHYYYFASIWNTVCFITTLGLCFGKIQHNWIAEIFALKASQNVQGDKLSIIIVMAILTIQSYRRLYECLFVSVFSDKGKINLIQYIWGLTYYSLLAPTLISESLPLNKLEFGQFESRHVVGILGFIFASRMEYQSHTILANLRKTKKVKQNSHGLPEGGMFTYVSCPHYFAEILAYISCFVIIHSHCASWWLLLLYLVVVHVCMAKGAHLWYKKTFPKYPAKRKALIPFLF